MTEIDRPSGYGITFVTSNQAKVAEAESILGFPLKVLNLEFPEIQGDLEEIAIQKAKDAFGRVRSPVIVDDVALGIKAWGGEFPGPYIKWVLKASSGNAELLLRLMQNERDRSAVARLAIVYYDGEKPHVFVGETEGEIAHEMRGENGFGWDPVFIPNGSSKTYAEMTADEKKEISHRRRGLDKLKEFLEKRNK